MNPFYESLEIIWERPKYVWLNGWRLKKIAREMAEEDLKIPMLTERTGNSGNDNISDENIAGRN